MTVTSGGTPCNHDQCQICFGRKCQKAMSGKVFRYYGGIMCCDSCVISAVNFAYSAACKFGGAVEHECEK